MLKCEDEPGLLPTAQELSDLAQDATQRALTHLPNFHLQPGRLRPREGQWYKGKYLKIKTIDKIGVKQPDGALPECGVLTPGTHARHAKV